MTQSSLTPAERARKTTSRVLQAMQAPGTAQAVAAAMGVSESTVSRLKSEQLEQFALLLAHLGFKVVPVETRTVDREMHDAMALIVSRAMADEETAQRLLAGGAD